MAIRVKNRENRYYEKSKKSDQREPFERDRDRLLYTSALRRLAGVTQVVRPGEGHVFHNRLTHTHEVAQLARRLAQKLIDDSDQQLRDAIGGIDPEVAEAAALAHDLGHPPFGHIAEQELHDLTSEEDACEGFEGNAQSFRIITKLAIRTSTRYGLNLTRATLNATLKYPWLRPDDADDDEFKGAKWGAYQTEKEVFQWVREYSGDTDRQSVEAAIMDWADDIAYAVHDLEDFYRAGLVPLDRLLTDDAERKRFIDAAFDRWDTPPCKRSDIHAFFSTLPRLKPYDGSGEVRGLLRELTSKLVGKYIQSATLIDNPAPDESYLHIPHGEQAEVKILKELTWQYVILNRSLLTQQHGQRQIIRTLYEIYREATRDEKMYGLLPPHIADRVRHLKDVDVDEVDAKSERVRLAADAVCSLTDREAVQTYKRLTGIQPGSVLDIV